MAPTRSVVSTGINTSVSKRLCGEQRLSFPQHIGGAVQSPENCISLHTTIMATRRIDVPRFHPTPEEFADFESYVATIEPEAKCAGLAIVVPPTGWLAEEQQQSPLLPPDFLIPSPVKQCCSAGGKGSYAVNLIEKKKDLTLAEFQAIAKAYERKNRVLPKRRGMAVADDEDATTCTEAVEAMDSLIERTYWRGLSSNMDPPIYGADVSGSLFPASCSSSWNLSRLDTLLSRGWPSGSPKLPGPTRCNMVRAPHTHTRCNMARAPPPTHPSRQALCSGSQTGPGLTAWLGTSHQQAV